MTHMIDLIDEFLADISSQRLIDGDKVRDFVLDLRLRETEEDHGEGLA